MVRPERFELPTYCSGGNRSIHLSYGRTPVFSSLHVEGSRINQREGRAWCAEKSETLGGKRRKRRPGNG